MGKKLMLYTGQLERTFTGVGKVTPSPDGSAVEFWVPEELAMSLARDPFVCYAPQKKEKAPEPEPVPLEEPEREKPGKKIRKGGEE
jgi:hypothetical protein